VVQDEEAPLGAGAPILGNARLRPVVGGVRGGGAANLAFLGGELPELLERRRGGGILGIGRFIGPRRRPERLEAGLDLDLPFLGDRVEDLELRDDVRVGEMVDPGDDPMRRLEGPLRGAGARRLRVGELEEVDLLAGVRALLVLGVVDRHRRDLVRQVIRIAGIWILEVGGRRRRPLRRKGEDRERGGEVFPSIDVLDVVLLVPLILGGEPAPRGRDRERLPAARRIESEAERRILVLGGRGGGRERRRRDPKDRRGGERRAAEAHFTRSAN
jgi:hypothetical protein